MGIKARRAALGKRLRQQRPPDQSTPTFRYQWVDGLLAVMGSLVCAGIVSLVLWLIAHPIKHENRLEFIKTALTVTGFIGVVLAAVYAYRKQRLTEAESHRADSIALGDRYSAAASQLADSSAAVRMAGVYAMARLADDWPAQGQTCVDVLCAYLRMSPATGVDSVQDEEVRATILQVIRDRVRIRPEKKPGAQVPSDWRSYSLNFTGVRFARQVDFEMSEFKGRVTFERAIFDMSATFNGCLFGVGQFSGAHFLGDVDFESANFGGTASFSGAAFGGESAYFNAIWFKEHANFEGGVLEEHIGGFTKAKFYFYQSSFSKTATFDNRKFESDVDFDAAEFKAIASFKEVEFRAEASFRGTDFAVSPQGSPVFNGRYLGDSALFQAPSLEV